MFIYFSRFFIIISNKMANTNTKVLIKDELVLDLIDSMIEIHSEKDMFKQYLKKSARKCYREYSYEIYIDIYDKYGNFIENINSFKLLKEKYEIPSSKLKDIQQGDKHFNDYIFKYNK